MIQLAEPAKNAELTFAGADVSRCAFATMYDAAAKMVYEAVVDLGARVIESWKAIPGRFPSYLVEHMTGVEEKVREDPRWQAGDAQARRHRLQPRDDRPLARRLLRPAGPLRQLGAAVPSVDVHAGGAVRARLRASGRGPDRHVRPRQDGGRRHRGPRRGADAADRGQLRREVHVRSEQPAGLHRVPSRRQADRDHPARRTQLHRRRLARDMAEVVSANRFQSARGHHPARGHLHRPRRDQAHHVPGVAVGDGGALRRHLADALEQERLRHG